MARVGRKTVVPYLPRKPLYFLALLRARVTVRALALNFSKEKKLAVSAMRNDMVDRRRRP